MGLALEPMSMHDTDSSDSTDSSPSSAEASGEVEVFTGAEERWTPRPQDSGEIPYNRIEPPAATPREDYTYVQRRAVLLDWIERVGHPRALRQSYRELADEFGASRSAIHRDMQALSAFIAANLDRDHVSIMDAVFRGAVLDLVEQDERARAAEIGRRWFEWLADMGEIERVADKVDLDTTVRHGDGDPEAYTVVDDQGEILENLSEDSEAGHGGTE